MFKQPKAIRPHKKGGLPKLCVIDYGEGNIEFVFLDQLKEAELEAFWEMSLEEKSCFLSTFCNHHHRLPRARGGHTSTENIAVVLTVSHQVYNRLVRIAAGLTGVNTREEKWEKRVNSAHISRALTEVYNIARVLLSDSDTGVLKNPEAVLQNFSKCWLPETADITLRQGKNGMPVFVSKKD